MRTPAVRPAALPYRPEIDGLRAVAILPVILFHAGVPGFGGGFIGVDVFFVISGYLITGIIAAALREDRFRFGHFYDRRARRILPALFPMLLCTALAAWLVFTPDDFRQFSQSLAATALFGSNFLFARKADYFYGDEGLQPLIHGWSLSVEEQFYLLFPAALVLIWKWRPKALLPAIFALLALSFALAVLAAPQEPRLAFYMLPTRMWELMAGAACALSPPLRRGRNVASLAGLAIIVAGLLVIDSETPAPGLLFALPVGGTTLVLLAAGQDTRAGRLLAFRPMVLLGLISYGTYLWHQPILAFLHYVWFGPAPLIATVGAVLASLALGWLSWVLIERPVRRKSVLASPASLAALCIGCLALAVSLGVAGHFRAVEPRSGAGDHKLGASYGGGNVDDALIPRGGALPFILYGDSHARQYYPALVERFGRGALLSKDGCLSLPGMTNWPRGSENAAACAAHAGSLARLLRERGTKRVIVAQRWDRAMWDTRSGAALGRTSGPAGPELLTGLAWLRASLPARTGLVLMGNAPTAWAYGPQMQRGYLRCQAYLNVQCPADYPASMAEGRKVNALLRQFAADHPGTAYLDAAAPLCPGGRCRIISDGRLYYSDGSHLTLTAARLVVARLPAPRPLP